MNPLLRLRTMTRVDIAFADSLRALSGWNQTRADWERFIAMSPEGCFLAEWDGAPVATATTIIHGSELGWIGMMLVHSEYRRRGIGRELLLRCIDHLQQRGVRCIKLDATPLGKKVYDSLGFRDEWALTRWQRKADASAPGRIETGIRRWTERDLDAIERLDTAAFGACRRTLLRHVLPGSWSLTLENSAADIIGYGALREGTQAHYLGPVIAASPNSGSHLVEALLERVSGRSVYWDIPDSNEAAVGLAKRHHFTPQRPLIRMCLGQNVAPGEPSMQFGIAGPEVG